MARNRLLNIFSRYNEIEKGIAVSNELHSQPKLNFKIYTASGGYVLEFYKYDYQKDKSESKLYVINSTEDLSESIATICQQEFLQL